MDTSSQNNNSNEPIAYRQPDVQPSMAPQSQQPTVVKVSRPRKWFERLLLLIIVLFLLVATGAAVYFWQHQKVADLEQQNTKLQSQVSSLKTQLSDSSATSQDGSGLSSKGDITTMADTAQAQANANSVEKRAEAYNAIQSRYPSTTDFNSISDSSLKGTGITLAGSATALTKVNGRTTIAYSPCGTAPNYTGYTINFYNFTSGTVQSSSAIVGGICK
jgi:cell division protein FtsL